MGSRYLHLLFTENHAERKSLTSTANLMFLSNFVIFWQKRGLSLKDTIE